MVSHWLDVLIAKAASTLNSTLNDTGRIPTGIPYQAQVTEVITQRVEEQNHHELSPTQPLGSVTDGFGHY